MRTQAAIALALCLGAIAPTAGAQIQLPPLTPPPEPPDDEPDRPDPSPPSEPPGPAPPGGTGSVTVGVNPAQTGHLPDDRLVPPLKVRWKAKVTALQMVAAEEGLFALEPHAVYGLDQASGRVLWRVPLEAFAQGLAYDSGTLFVTTFDTVFGIDPATGHVLWQREVDGARAPVASGGVVYLAYRTSNPVALALRASDGELLWSHAAPAVDVPTLDAEHVYFPSTCGSAVALRRTDGAQAWQHGESCDLGAGFAVLSTGRLFLPYPVSDERAAAPVLDARTGSELGRHHGGSPVIAKGLRIYTGSEGTIARRVTGDDVVWRTGRRRALESPIAVGHDLYGLQHIDPGSTRVVALDVASGRGLWAARIRHPYGCCPPAIAAAPGLLFVSVGDGVFAMDNVFKPGPREIEFDVTATDVLVGEAVSLGGVLGSDLRGKDVRLELGRWPHRRFYSFGRVPVEADGGFADSFGPLRSVRVRLRAGRVVSPVRTVFAYPRVRLRRARRAGRLIRLPVTVRTPRLSLDGRTFVLYLHRAGASRAKRLDHARLDGRPGRSRAELLFRPLRRVGRRDQLYYCIRGQLQLGLGRPSPLLRRCGARRVPVPSR